MKHAQLSSKPSSTITLLELTEVMMAKSQGELESAVSSTIIRFKRDYMGRGPQEVRTFLVEDMAIVRLRGVLTPAEQRLAQVEDPHRGRDLIKQLRIELIEHGRELLVNEIQNILDVPVVSLHTDISTRTGESIILFTLASNPIEKREEDLP